MKTVVRLDKYLADMGVGTRSDVKNKIRRGQVTVNGQSVRSPETKVDTQADQVFCDGNLVGYSHYEYYMLHKPAGVISAANDPKAVTVVDLITDKRRKDLFPVGRLDKDTEGLLLITNDGDLTHRLLSPKKHVPKVYYARIDGEVTLEDVKLFEKGLIVDDTFTALPAKLEILSVQPPHHEADGETGHGSSEITLEIHEGKFHQVKRMFEAVGKPVTYLKRLSMGPLALDKTLAPGEYRSLRSDELELLKALGNLEVSEPARLLADKAAVIFDMDGTLIDSMWVWRDIDREYLGRFGLEMPDDLQEAIAGISITQTALYFQKTFGITDSVEKMIGDWDALAYEKYTKEIPLKAGVLGFLKMLKEKNIPCAVATSSSRRLTQGALGALGIRDYFDVVLTGEDIHKGKPDPDIYLETAKALGVAAKKCLVFEDIPLGIAAAKAAGMTCIAVDDLFSAADMDRKLKLSDGYIYDFDEMRKSV